MGRVRVARADGELGSVDEAELQQAIDSGFRVVSSDEANQIRARREAESAGSSALAAIEGAAAGATLGLSTLAADAVLGPGYAKRAKARQQANESLSTAGEVIGGVAATVGTGGLGGVAGGAARAGAAASRVGALGRGAAAAGRAVASPARAAARAGIAAERALGGGVAGGLARGAIEGGAAGIGSTIHESVLGGQEITAERLVAGGASGAFLGGAVGGGVPLGAKLLAGGAKESTKAMQSVLSGHTGQEVTEEVAKAAARSGENSMLATAAEKLAPLQGADAGAAKRVFGLVSSDSPRLHRILTRQKSTEAKITSAIQEDLTAVRSALEEGRIATQGGSKYRRAAELVPESRASQEIAEKVRSELASEIDEMMATNARHFGSAFETPALLKAQGLTGRAMQEMAEAPTAAGAFQALDRMKRDLGVLVSDTGGWGAPKPGMLAAAETNKRLRGMYKKAQKHLEREDLWGEAAVLQKEINGSFGAMRAAQDAFRAEGAAGLSKMFTDTGEVNIRQAIAIARQYRRMGGESAVNKLDDALEAQINHLRVQKKHYELDATQTKRIDDAEKALERFRSKMRDQAEDAAILDDLESLRESESARSVSMGAASTLGPAVGGTLGLSIGGIPGAALGMVAGGIMRPYTSARHLAALKDLADGFAGKTTNAITPAVNAVRGLVTKAAKGAKASTRGAPAAAARVGVSRKERREQNKRARENAMYLATQPGALADAMNKTTELLSEVAPGVARSMGQVTQRAALFLASKAPPVYQRPLSGKPPLSNPLEVDRYARFVEAVTDPVGALSRLHRGSFTRDHAEAMRVVYPEIFADVQRQVMDAVIEAQRDGGTVPYSVRTRMAALFDTPSDPAMAPDRLIAIQTSLGNQEAEEEAELAQMAGNGGGGGKVRASGGSSIDPTQLQTPAQRVASGQARA